MARAAGLLCGVDEAGRGPLAGPVFAAAVVLDPGRRIRGLDDSKKLPEHTRVELASLIKERAIAWAVASASVEEIDALNILQATLLAMQRAIAALGIAPDRVLVDGLHCPPIALETRAVVDGDAKVKAISAASILAKTARDGEMVRLAAVHPQYGFDRHKGYATLEHIECLLRFGPCAAHRRSFRPVRVLLGGEQPELFAPVERWHRNSGSSAT
ncbi:MAG TPA: ribonuclease HII [Burkholderiales bacterium]|nr:ribonuclease HII [Burkholderiales bacterium]